MADRESSADIEAAAALWAVRADDAAPSPDDEAALEAWLAGDLRRLGAYARARAMLAQADRLKALGTDFDPDGYILDHAAPAGQIRRTAPRPTRRKVLIGGSAAIAIGSAAVVGLSWPAAATTYSTRRGEIRLVPLGDGSSMTLNTQTTAKVLFTREERHVELIEGEVLFDIAREADRPFIVEAGTSRVQAAATSFTVSRLAHEAVKVTVRQGSVQVSGLSAQPTILTANTQAMVPLGMANIQTATIAAPEMNRDLAWQQGMLSFEDTPLAKAADQFSRYSDTAIRFGDPSVGEETITGLYAANNPQGFARSAALSLGLKASERPGAIILSR